MSHRGAQLLNGAARTAGTLARTTADASSAPDEEQEPGATGIRVIKKTSTTTSKALTPWRGQRRSSQRGRRIPTPSRDRRTATRSAVGQPSRSALTARLRRGAAAAPVDKGVTVVQTGTAASRTAAASARAAAAAANAVRTMVTAITSALSSSPAAIVAALVVTVMVIVVAAVGWLLPGVQQQRESAGGHYGIGIEPGPWGGWKNGFIPEELLSPIPWAQGYRLRPDAVQALGALNVEYRTQFGHDLVINDGYRDYAGQVQAVIDYGSNATTPGTSIHGWALAVDFGEPSGAAISFGSDTYQWLVEHAEAFGYRHPAWAAKDGSRPEAWHWEFWGWAGPAGIAGGDPSEAKAYARAALGVDGIQFDCLERLWNGESNWNPHAVNASSGAYGIPQALPAEKLAAAGTDWRDNPLTQVRWGLTYITDRYGTPCGAWAFWQSNTPHWY